MTDATPPHGDTLEHHDEAGRPGGTEPLTEDQLALIEQVMRSGDRPIDDVIVSDITVTNEEENRVYTAMVGDTALGAISYSRVGDRFVLLAAAVYPEFRRHGVATEMIRQVLDDVRRQRLTVTILCPIVRAFINKHLQYADLIDPNNPGVTVPSR
ncbi:hypothetical protein GCM10027568_28510 [Humibacter soli]